MRQIQFKIYPFLVLLIGMILSANETLAQCAMCCATVENNVSNGDVGLASNLNLGILYLFVTPYVVIAVIAFFWYKKSKEHAKKVSLSSYYKRKMPQV